MPSPEPSSAPGIGPSVFWRLVGWRKTRLALVLGVALILLLIAPFHVNQYWQRVLTSIFMFAALAQAVNLIAGFTGYPAFGNVVFFGLGAYSVAIVMTRGGSFALGCVVALLVSLVTVLLIGPYLLRLRGHYFAIVTVGLNEMIKALAANLTLTGGGMGLSLPLPHGTPAQTTVNFYYMLLALMLVSILLAAWFRVSRLGLACRAIRDDEIKAEAMGLRTVTIKVAAWSLSAMLTGVAGAIYAYWFSYVEPPAVFDMLIAIKSFVIFLLGGPATVFGPVIAAFVVELLSTVLWSNLLHYHLGALGLGIMLIVLFMPNGFMRFMHDRGSTAAPLGKPAK